VVEMAWKEEQSVLPAQLALGVYRTDVQDGPLSVRPLPPVERALEEIIAVLWKLGHEVIEWEPPSHHNAMEIAVRKVLSLSLRTFLTI
jgi:amidase